MMGFLPPELLSILAAVGFAVGDVIGRFAVRHSPPFMGGFLSAVTGLVIFGLIWLAAPAAAALNAPGAFWFFLAGMFTPGFGFVGVLKSFERSGVARTAAMLGTSPFFGVLIAILFLGERPGWALAAGTAVFALAGGLLDLSSPLWEIALKLPVLALFVLMSYRLVAGERAEAA